MMIRQAGQAGEIQEVKIFVAIESVVRQIVAPASQEFHST
jgi:hypothetical protein